MEINDSSSVVISSAIKIHTKLGSGVFESAYRRLLRHELMLRGCSVECEKVLDLEYEGVVFERAYRVDMVVNEHLLVELKSVDRLSAMHFKQILTYLRLSNLQVGLLINFGQSSLKAGIHRVVNRYVEP